MSLYLLFLFICSFIQKNHFHACEAAGLEMFGVILNLRQSPFTSCVPVCCCSLRISLVVSVMLSSIFSLLLYGVLPPPPVDDPFGVQSFSITSLLFLSFHLIFSMNFS